MSVGHNNHYQMDEIQRRHFRETSDAAGLPIGTVDSICKEFQADVPGALDQIASLAGNIIPAGLVESLSEGIRSRQRALELG